MRFFSRFERHQRYMTCLRFLLCPQSASSGSSRQAQLCFRTVRTKHGEGCARTCCPPPAPPIQAPLSMTHLSLSLGVCLQSTGSSRHEQLYDHALLRQARAKQTETWLPEEYTFKPATNRRMVLEGFVSPRGSMSVSDRQVPTCTCLFNLLLRGALARHCGKWLPEVYTFEPPTTLRPRALLPVRQRVCSGWARPQLCLYAVREAQGCALRTSSNPAGGRSSMFRCFVSLRTSVLRGRGGGGFSHAGLSGHYCH